MSPSFSISLLALFAGFCTFETLAHQAAIPLITVKENNDNSEDQFLLNPDAISMIKKLSSPVKVIAAIGDARVGKSTALNFIHYTLGNVGNSAFHTQKAKEIFETGNTMEAVTHGVWISTVRIHGKDGMENLILLDVEGTDLGDDSVTDKLSIFTALMSSCLTLFMKEFPSSHITEFLFKIVRLSEVAFGEENSEHFPLLTAVVRAALAPPKSYRNIDEYIIDALITPKWKDKSDEKRKVIGRRFPKHRISVFNLPLVPNPQTTFQSVPSLLETGYLNAIEMLTSNLSKLTEKKTLNGGLMDGQTLADLAERLVNVMNDQQQWSGLNPNFYDLFENEVCRKSAKRYIEPILELPSREIERERLRAFNRFKEKCKLENQLIIVDDTIQFALESRRKKEEKALAKDREREAAKKEPLTFLLGTIVGAIGAAGALLLSDVQLKENIVLVNNSEYETIGLRGVEWVWNKEAERLGLSGRGSGVVAQDVELLYPWAVTEGHDGYKRVNYFALRLLIYAQKFQSLESPYKRYVETCEMHVKVVH